ncbi:MAG: hypothetical protein P1U57_11775 [Oleibacter sp.]|nr:hypothetical protein [Thalassolituus sp.]
MARYRSAPAGEKLRESLDRLPGIGQQAAQRISDWCLYRNGGDDLLNALSAALSEPLCSSCRLRFDPRLGASCPLCAEFSRQQQPILVVQNTKTAHLALESGYSGGMFVLHGVLSPSNNVGPTQLYLDTLFERAQLLVPRTLYVALESSVEAQVTLEFIARRLPAHQIIAWDVDQLPHLIRERMHETG